MASQYERQRELAPWYLFVAALLSSIVVILWRLYTHYLDNQIAGYYSSLIFCEKKLCIPDDLSMWGHFLRRFKDKCLSLRQEALSLCAEQRRRAVSDLVEDKRYGCRGHNTFNIIAFGFIFVVWALTLCLGCWHPIVLALSTIGLVLFLLIFVVIYKYAQRDPSSSDLQRAIDHDRSASK